MTIDWQRMWVPVSPTLLSSEAEVEALIDFKERKKQNKKREGVY